MRYNPQTLQFTHKGGFHGFHNSHRIVRHYNQCKNRDTASKSSNPRYRHNYGLGGLSHVPNGRRAGQWHSQAWIPGNDQATDIIGDSLSLPWKGSCELKPAVKMSDKNIWHFLLSCSLFY